MIDAKLRSRLADALTEAAELEHDLLCQYLFAAFSFKRRTDEGVTWAQLEVMRRWEASILLVARQEMEHLGLVSNLLTAIGEAPHLERPRSDLERLTPSALRRFIVYERPLTLTPDEQALLDAKVPDLVLPAHHSIAELYAEISSLFTQLGEAVLIGPPSAQLATAQVIPVPLRGITLGPTAAIYDISLSPVTDIASVQAIITQIVDEGEGAPGWSGTSHFARFIEIYAELAAQRLADPGFDPARPVIEDAPLDAIEDPDTRAVSELFDLGYMTMLLLLMRFLAQTDESSAQIDELQRATFFPLMTTVIRPLGEILSELPVKSGEPSLTAGAGFRIERSLGLLPHQAAAWTVFQTRLGEFAAEATRLAAVPDLAAFSDRLTLMSENVSRVITFFDSDPDA